MTERESRLKFLFVDEIIATTRARKKERDLLFMLINNYVYTKLYI